MIKLSYPHLSILKDDSDKLHLIHAVVVESCAVLKIRKAYIFCTATICNSRKQTASNAACLNEA